jgi:hypothetical protein
MNLTSRTLVSLFDNINEESKSEVMSELISRVPIEKLVNHSVIIQKYKDEILTQDYLTSETKYVIKHSYDPFFLFWCYNSKRFLMKLNTRMHLLNLWKFYYIFEGNIHITQDDAFLQKTVFLEKIPFDLQKILIEGTFNMDNIFVDEYENFEGRMVISSSPKWYESLHIFKFSPV